jgi:hypothetical protein
MNKFIFGLQGPSSNSFKPFNYFNHFDLSFVGVTLFTYLLRLKLHEKRFRKIIYKMVFLFASISYVRYQLNIVGYTQQPLATRAYSHIFAAVGRRYSANWGRHFRIFFNNQPILEDFSCCLWKAVSMAPAIVLLQPELHDHAKETKASNTFNQ